MKRLYDLDPNEVSLVARGANKKKFLIFKSRKGNEMAKRADVEQLVNAVDAKTMASIEKILKGMSKKADKEDKEKKEKAKKTAGAEDQVTHEGLSDRAQAALKAVARILAPFKDEISDEHLDAVQNEVGIEPGPGEDAEHHEDGEHADVEMSMEIPEGVEEEHHSGAQAAAKKAYADHLEKMGYKKYPDPSLEHSSATKSADDDADGDEEEEEEESVSKVTKSALDLSAFPKEQRAQLESIFKANTTLAEENKTLVQKTADLEKQLKEERDIRVLKGFEEKARGFKHLSANTEELAVVMKELCESNPKGYDKLEAMLKAADEQVRVAKATGNLFGEVGSRQGGAAGGAPEDKLEALVDSFVAKSDGSKSREQIYEEVLKTKEGRRLYAEFKSARPHGT